MVINILGIGTGSGWLAADQGEGEAGTTQLGNQIVETGMAPRGGDALRWMAWRVAVQPISHAEFGTLLEFGA